MHRAIRFIIVLLFALMLSSCSSSIKLEIQTDIPKAAMDPSSRKVGLVIGPEFANYVYRENSDARENWEVAVGKSQSALFEGIFSSAFGNVSLSAIDSSKNDAELVFIPQLVEMQLATPSETGFTFFEAWLNYALTIRATPKNKTQTVHIVAYGKENTARFQGKHEGLHKAIESALRDAGAKLTIQLIALADDESVDQSDGEFGNQTAVGN